MGYLYFYSVIHPRDLAFFFFLSPGFLVQFEENGLKSAKLGITTYLLKILLLAQWSKLKRQRLYYQHTVLLQLLLLFSVRSLFFSAKPN